MRAGVGVRGPDDTHKGHTAAAEASVDIHLGLGHLLALPAGLQQGPQEPGLATASMAAPCHHHGPLLDHAGQVGRDPQHSRHRGQQLAGERLRSGRLWDQAAGQAHAGPEQAPRYFPGVAP